MQTLDLRGLDPESPTGVARLGEALDVFGEGGILAFPTDTVWGVGTCSQNLEVLERIYTLKQRPTERPLSYLIPSSLALEPIFEDEVPELLEQAAERYWPGPTTLIVDADPGILPGGRRGAPGVGLRIPDHAMLRRLLTGLPPLANTSANPSGKAVLDGPQAIIEAFGGQLDWLILMDQEPAGGASEVRYLRPGLPDEILRI